MAKAMHTERTWLCKVECQLTDFNQIRFLVVLMQNIRDSVNHVCNDVYDIALIASKKCAVTSQEMPLRYLMTFERLPVPYISAVTDCPLACFR